MSVCETNKTSPVTDFVVPAAPPAIEVVTLRPAILADAPALALVGAATFLEAFTWMLPGPDIIAHCTKNHTAEAYRNYLAEPNTRITLAVTGLDAPVGYAMLCTPEFPTFAVQSQDIELKRIYLFSRFRSANTPVLDLEGKPTPNLRTGQALMNSAVDNARVLGGTRLLLGTHAGNQQAIAFYRRNGFIEVGTRTFQVGQQCCFDLIFGKELG